MIREVANDGTYRSFEVRQEPWSNWIKVAYRASEVKTVLTWNWEVRMCHD